MHHCPASRQGHILAPINSLSVCTVAKSQVSDLNGSRLCIVGVISPSSQASYDQLLRSALGLGRGPCTKSKYKFGTKDMHLRLGEVLLRICLL